MKPAFHKMKYLFLSDNNISDLTPLSGILANLVELDFSKNVI